VSNDDVLNARATSILQQTLLGDAAEHAEVGVMAWNEERNYVAMNDCACRMLGRTRAELLGTHVGETNRANSAGVVDAILAGTFPAHGRTTMPDGNDVEWLCVETTIAGMPHVFGVMWLASE
jgi:PAS domain-containing protein